MTNNTQELAIEKLGGHYISLQHLKVWDNIIIDAGACVGEASQAIIKNVDIKILYCLEPGNLNFKELKEKFADNNKVNCCKYVLTGDNSPNMPVYYDFRLPNTRYREWGGIEGLNKNRRQLIDKYIVTAIKLNDIFSVLSIDYIDYLKMDIEGTETDIVMTMTQTTADKIGQMSMEVHNNDIKELTIQLNKLGFVTIIKPGELYACNKRVFNEN